MKEYEIIIVDDEPLNISILSRVLSSHYKVRACKSGNDLLKLIHSTTLPDLILLDIMMPELDGYEVLAQLKKNEQFEHIPVIFISGLGSSYDEEKGLHLGAVDYITKPFNPTLVLERVKTQLELKHARDILKDKNEWLEAEVNRRLKENLLIQDATLFVITELTEAKDVETSKHILRTRSYVEVLANEISKLPKYKKILTEEVIRRIVKATPLHDIGKIGVPDAILNKPGIYTPEEFEIMKNHCMIGGNAIKTAMQKAYMTNRTGKDSLSKDALAFLKEAEIIATFHHEKWDGSGYPLGLKGEAIPISARLMSLADVFDALTNTRVYKRAWSTEETKEYIVSQSGIQFDPQIVDCFIKKFDLFEEIRNDLNLENVVDSENDFCDLEEQL